MTLHLERSDASPTQQTPTPLVSRPRRTSSQTPDVFLPGWPLITALVGLPLWWVLGFTQVAFFVLAIPMAVHLLRLRVVQAPRGFGIWLLFLAWLLAGLFVIRVQAPGTLATAGLGPYLTFGYRFGWYAVGTVALLYVANTRSILSTERIAGALSYVFLTIVAGGYLGLLLPRLEFASALEAVLPTRLASEQFVRDLVHAQTAQVQTFLGGEDARPSAPFRYTNQWGLCIALTLPFFITEWWQRGGRWRAALGPLGVIAAVPIILSLNRGLWAALLVMIAFYGLRTAIDGRFTVVIGLAVVAVIAAVFIAVSPAGDLISQRLNTPHSNETRENLSVLSVQSTLDGSPFIGFGSTRNVPGNFNSIAGGATEDCPRCSPPPLGTGGQLWLLVFGGGLGALTFFVAFFGLTFWRHFRDASPYSLASLCSLVALFVTMPVYTSVGFGVYVALIGVGLLSREEPLMRRPPLGQLLRKLGRNSGLVLLVAAIGGMVGIGVQAVWGTHSSATQSVLVPQADLTGVQGRGPSLSIPKP